MFRKEFFGFAVPSSWPDMSFEKVAAFAAECRAAQKGRLILWAPVCLALGIALYFQIGFEPPLWLGGVLFGVSGVFALIIFYLKKSLYHNVFILLFLFLIILGSAGFWAAQIRTHLAFTPMLTKALGPVSVQGKIVNIEILEKPGTRRVTLSNLSVERLAPHDTPRRVRLYVREAGDLKSGQIVNVLARLNPPSPPVLPGAFDFQRHAYFKGIGAVGFAYYPAEVLKDPPQGHYFKDLQQIIAHRLQERMSAREGGFAVALTTGQKGAIKDADQNMMRDAGLAHLLAISGMHIGMVATLLFFSSRLFMAFFPAFALRHPIKKYAALIALFGALFYTFLTGASVSTQRAMIMTGIVLIAIMMDRSPFSLRLVAIAALAVLLVTPENLMSVSFQMSFAAVTALIAFYEATREQWARFYAQKGALRRLALYLGGVALTTLVAEIAVAPFSIYHFQHHSVYGILANLLAVPVTAFLIMPFLVLSLMAMPFGVEAPFLWVAEIGIALMIRAAQLTTSIEGAVFTPAAYSAAAFGLIVLGGTGFCLIAGRARIFALLPVMAGIMLSFHAEKPDILVSGDAKTLAIQAADGRLAFMPGRSDNYVRENWMRLYGQASGEKTLSLPKEGKDVNGGFACGEGGCRGLVKGKKIALPTGQNAWREDCGWADLMISPFPVDKACEAEIVIDRFDLWREGAHAIFINKSDNENLISIKTVEGARGRRLWSGVK